MHHDQQKLNAAGYVTKEFTRYHFQVKKKGGKVKVNVWPTARKILKEFSPGPAPYYTDVVAAVKKIFDEHDDDGLIPQAVLKYRAKKLKEEYPIEINEEYRYLQWWKYKPMERLEEYVENI